MIRVQLFLVFAVVALLVGCASGPPAPPYPAYIVSDELPDLFMASLPGIRAKQYAGNDQTRATSNRIDLPADWSGTTGGSPGMSLEIFVLEGELRLADVSLQSGGYAYLPPGTFGFNLKSADGARILYFLESVDDTAMIQTPLILDSGLVDWKDGDHAGTATKDLRVDPGSGERTWLLRIEPAAMIPWESVSVSREGYLVAGQYQHSECVDGEPYTDIYLPGGYFKRPADAVNGGPQSMAITSSTWLLRESRASTATAATCSPN